MGRRTEVVMTDDLDPEQTADETLRVALDDVTVELDLTSENAARLRETLQPWLAAGRRVRVRRRRAASEERGMNMAARAWAQAQGIEVSEKGRVPKEVKRQFQAAQKAGAKRDDHPGDHSVNTAAPSAWPGAGEQ